MNTTTLDSTDSPETSPVTNSSVPFVMLVNGCIEQLYVLAAQVRPDEPGTAEIIVAFAETLAGSALDLVQGWPW